MINTFTISTISTISTIPDNDNERLKALHQYQIIDADVGDSFENIAKLMAETFDVPIALISLVDKEEVIFKGNFGLTDVKKESRGISLCALTVLEDEVYVIQDASQEKSLQSNPHVIGGFGLKFYAGAPLTTKSGYHIGTVSIVDKKTRLFSEKEILLLKRFSKIVMNEIELRFEARKTALNYSETIEKQRNNLLIREAQLSLAQELAKMASWEWILSEPVIKWSPEMYKFWKFNEGEIDVTLERVAKMTHPDDLNILQNAVKCLQEGDEADIQYRRYDKFGNEIFIHTKTIINKDNEGKPYSVFGIDMDISELRSIQDNLTHQNVKLSQANKELSSFNYVTSHDLKEPIRKIQMFISRIENNEHDFSSEKIQYYFSRIIDASKRMESLIDSLLTFSKVSNFTELKFVQTDLNFVLTEVMHNYSEIIDEKNAIINAPSLPTIRAVPEQILQVFSNILSNSLKYSNAGVQPVITISVNKIERAIANGIHHAFWEIQISDNGIGFEQIYAEKIFEVFQRLHTRTEYEGTGIGLAICKKVMQTHGGDIIATSNYGEGAVFKLYFPNNG